MGKAPSNETSALTNMNMDIWVVGTSNQLFKKRFLNWKKTKKCQKIKVVTGKTPFIVIGPFRILHSFCLDIGFWQGSFVLKCCVFNLRGFNYKTLLQFFEKDFCFSKDLFQSSSIKDVQNFQWLSGKNMPISQTEGYFENP